MIEIKLDSWAQFKNIYLEKNLAPQWVLHKSNYVLYAGDSYIVYVLTLNPIDAADFEANYKNQWNIPLEYRDNAGLPRVHASSRPCNTSVYFAGADDSDIKIIFDIKVADVSKSKDVTFSEPIHLKDIIIDLINAPLGSNITIEILDSNDVVIKKIANKVNLLGTGPRYLNTEDNELFTNGNKLRATINNSNGTGDEDTAADFQVAVNIETYRSNTV